MGGERIREKKTKQPFQRKDRRLTTLNRKASQWKRVSISFHRQFLQDMKKALCCNFLFWNYPRLKDLWSRVDERKSTGARFLKSLSLLRWRNNPGLLSCFESFLLLPINVTYCNDYKKSFPRPNICYKESGLQK